MSARLDTVLVILASAALASGCGRPVTKAGGPPPDAALPAVVAEVAVEALEDRAPLIASLQARDAVDLIGEINARVETIGFAEGEVVAEGQVLFRLDERKLKARAEEADARFALARTLFERSRDLLASQTVSQQEYDQAEAEFKVAEASLALAREQLSDAVIRAPFDGVTGERRVSEGQLVSVGQVLGMLVRLDPLEAAFHVPERYVGQLRMGQQVAFTSVAYPDEAFEGKVFFIAPEVDAQSRTLLVKAEIPNGDHRLRPGMYGSLNLVFQVRADALTIPEAAVRFSGDHANVVVVNADSRAEFRNVTLGQRLPGRVEVVDGLAAGDRVVVEGHQKLGPGSRIEPRAVSSGASPQS